MPKRNAGRGPCVDYTHLSTTGKPKGVMVYHRGIYAVCMVQHSKELEDAAAQGGARRSVPACVLHRLRWLCCSCLDDFSQGCHASDGLAIRLPRGNNDCQSLNLTPSMLAALEPSGSYDHVRYIFLGAYAPKLDVGRRWITKNRKVFTMYGPSETICVISFIGELHPAQEVPFGELIPGVKVVWGDEEMKESNHGKVLISGPGLAAGYLNNLTLTAKKISNGTASASTGQGISHARLKMDS